jgi:hypothetical protein
MTDKSQRLTKPSQKTGPLFLCLFTALVFAPVLLWLVSSSFQAFGYATMLLIGPDQLKPWIISKLGDLEEKGLPALLTVARDEETEYGILGLWLRSRPSRASIVKSRTL